MKRKAKLNPVEIVLPQREVLENGTIVVDLPTLFCFEEFWGANRNKFQFACQGMEAGFKPAYLRDYQWVFGVTKASVVETVLRLGRSEIHVAWYDWKTEEKDDWEFFFADQHTYRSGKIEEGVWTAEDEEKWQTRTEENYHGWWRFEGVPDSSDINEWFGIGSSAEQLIDPNMPLADVTTKLCEQTFDEWADIYEWELKTHTAESVQETIDYWLQEKSQGEDYYGAENESPTSSCSG